MDDAESLFGSPPPTPTRGRSLSPALALPSFSENIINFSSSSAQNVGAIALPGSHNFSELAVNPLALSLSHPTPQNGDALRPPAQSSGAFMTQVRPHTPGATPSVAPTHVVSVSAPTKRKTLAARKPKPPKPKAATPRPTPPPIHLPDPSDPLPPNLLRNQPGLLGTAGVVGGVRAAHLPAPNPPTETRIPSPNQGTTSSDPIFVDDEPPRARSSFKRPLHFNGDVAALPPPSNRDIISTLIEQKEIFPLLETILKFIASAQSSQSPSRSNSDAGSRSQTPESGPSKKKRKVRRVPAGAELWDVPFPFPEGEAPPAYQNDWERGRGKSLIADLVTLIKRAAKKAAITNFLDKRNALTEAQRAALGKHYRVDTLFYGSGTEVLADASNASSPAVSSSEPAPPSPPVPSSSGVSIPSDTPSTAFDQLITSLLSASSTEQISWDSGRGLDGLIDTPAPLDTGLFNSWMDIFQAFPFPAEGFTPQTQLEDYHIDPQQTFLNIPESLTATSALDTPSPALSFDFPTDFSQTFPENYNPATLDQLMIDPILLALSTSASNMPAPIDTSMSNFSDSGCPSLAGSPMPSVSSLSSFGPMTPTETRWSGDAGLGVYSPGEEHEHGAVGMRAEARVQPVASTSACVQPPAADVNTVGTSKGKKRDFSSMAGWTDAEKDALNFLEVLSKSKLGQVRPRADEDSQDDVGKDPQDVEFSKLPTLPIVGSLVKADVLARAKQRKEELAAEIVKTRVGLWETTIEGGVLAGVVKYYSTN